MSIILTKQSKIIIQGITGKEGQRAAEFMLASNTNILAGIRPGKEGENVLGIPVFDTIINFLENKNLSQGFLDDIISLIIIPPQFVKSACIEALNAGIKKICIVTEGVSIHDINYCIDLAKEKQAIIIGPNTVGIISPGIGKIGLVGGKDALQFTSGNIGIISKSGGMMSEIAMSLTKFGLGQSTAICIGGDPLLGYDMVDAIKDFAKDEFTKSIVIFGEIGGSYEEDLAQYLKDNPINKPIVAYISGEFAQKYTSISFGHAGAIIHANLPNIGTRDSKIESLKSAGVIIANTIDQIPHLISLSE